MTATVDRRSTATAWPRLLWVIGTLLLITMVVHLVAIVVTGGPWTGPVSLRKPATFAETGWLAAWSVALIMPRMRMRAWQQHVVGGSVALFGVGETAIIGLQAWRGVPSHYNFTTPFDAALMRGGAAGTAGVFLVGTLVLLVATLRSTGTGRATRFGVTAGILLLILGCALGLIMIFNNSGVYEGTIGADFRERTTGYLGPDAATIGPEYLLIRPSTAGGDLVLLHAIGVHGLVLLAVPAVLLDRAGVSAIRRSRLVVTTVGAVAVAVTILLVHALRGLPLGLLPPWALAVLALCVVALLASYVTIGRLCTAPRSSRVTSM